MDSGGVFLNSTDSNLEALHVGRRLAGMVKSSKVVQDTSYDASTIIVCYSPTMTTTNGIWQGDKMLDYSLPLFILQAIMIIVITRTLFILIRRFRQPRFIAEVLGGIVLGPSLLGLIPNYMLTIFPTRSFSVLDTMASLGLLYFIFLVGLQVDLSAVSKVGKQAWAVTSAGVILPIIVELMAFLFFGRGLKGKENVESYLIFIGVSLSVTAYPVLTRILAEIKLLHTETGKLAMSAAILNNGIAWVLLAIALALAGTNRSYIAPVGIILSAVIFVIFLYYTVRPAAYWIMAHTKEGEAVDEAYVVGMLVLVLVCGVVSDTLGIHAVFGAFTLGVVTPNGCLGAVLIEKLEDFNSGFMMPLYFAMIGLNVDLTSIRDPSIFGFLIGVIFMGGVAKVGIVVLVSMFYAVPTREGLSLGILMNTKGLMEIIVLDIALDKKVLYTQSYSTMVVMSVVMTALVTPLTMMVHGQTRRFAPYKRRTLQKGRPDAELRMVACIHTTRNVPSIISLLDISNPSKNSPIFVYAAHLVELTGRESAMLIVHDNNQGTGKRNVGGGGGQGNINRVKAQSDQIVKAFDNYEQYAGGVSVQPVTVVSAYSTMHEDVCNIAEDKHAALLIIPFHKQHTVDGEMETMNPEIHTLNQNILANAPCSVGILVDRGLGGSGRISGSQHATRNIVLLFIGGPDDREALAYIARMADHPGINITVIRFIDANSPQSRSRSQSQSPYHVSSPAPPVISLSGREKECFFDDECIKEFRVKTMNDESVMYVEKVVQNGEETVTIIRSMDKIHDLYVVGRGEGSESPLMEGLTDWTESPDLGAIGDLLASSDFTSTVSVLVIQQYKESGPAVDAPGSPPSDTFSVKQYLSRANNRATPTDFRRLISLFLLDDYSLSKSHLFSVSTLGLYSIFGHCALLPHDQTFPINHEDPAHIPNPNHMRHAPYHRNKGPATTHY